jgi:alkanesulfonate monooxygenase SsuD/methylene tetrahydromethanopterin reductase-like flavin-dependent oxidoreductase (luciferase family)
MTLAFELGLDTFGDRTLSPSGELVSHAQALRDVVEQAVLADQVGLDFIGLGEHHRDDFAISAPEVLLGAIASRTKRIKLGTAVTVLSTDDPIRVFQRFSTLSALSGGRAEVLLGRGSFTESFPLFGFDLADYEMLFEEKLALFAAVRGGGHVRWKGKHRPPLDVARVVPPVEGGLLPTWVGVGGTPQSVVRAASYGCRSGSTRRATSRRPPPMMASMSESSNSARASVESAVGRRRRALSSSARPARTEPSSSARPRPSRPRSSLSRAPSGFSASI